MAQQLTPYTINTGSKQIMHTKNKARRLTGRIARGFSMLEVLVALVLISLGFLSMLALQGGAAKYSRAAYYRGVATQIGSGLAASIRANPKAVIQYTFQALMSLLCTTLALPVLGLQAAWRGHFAALIKLQHQI